MKMSWPRAAAIVLLVVTLAVAIVIAIAWLALPLDRITLALEGQTYSLADLHGSDALVAFGVVVALVVVALVAALGATVVGLAVGSLGLAVGLLAAVTAIACVVAPFALVGWLLWGLFRSARPRATGVVGTP